MTYDICLAWNWEYDAAFVGLLEQACLSRRLGLLQITPDTIEHVSGPLHNGQLSFHSFLDRASDSDERFLPITEWARRHARLRINPHERAVQCWDKAAMHQVLSATLDTPLTVVLPSFQEQPDLLPIELTSLGERFSIKPAHGGGGEGVVVEATAMEQVLVARREHPNDRYLLQAHVAPAQIGSRPAWYRIIYCTGKAFACWWDTGTHVYTPVTAEEEAGYHLDPLGGMASQIARICGLDLFSTEIAQTAEGRFIVVDYVNDPIDLRLQSQAAEGVPDDIVRDIAGRLASLVATSVSA